MATGKEMKENKVDHYTEMQYYINKKKYNRLVKKENNKAKAKLSNQISNLVTTNGQQFWQLVNTLRQYKRPDNPMEPDIWLKYLVKILCIP